MKYDAPTVSDLGGMIGVISEPHLHDETGNFTWTTFNPGLLSHKLRTYVTLRSSNYEILTTGEYRLLGYSQIRNRLWLGELQPDLTIGDLREVDMRVAGFTRGLEDARLFRDADGTVRIAATGLESWIPKARVVQLRLDLETATVHEPLVLPGLTDSAIEKSWMPVHDGRADFDYLHSSGHTWSRDLGFREVEPKIDVPLHLRGNTPLIPRGDSWIGVMHQTFYSVPEDRIDPKTFARTTVTKRKYVNYLVQVDRVGRIERVSRGFYLRKPGVEFPTGIIEADQGYVISYGENDRRACVAFLPHPVVDSMFTWDTKNTGYPTT
jgi:hypothetical protein